MLSMKSSTSWTFSSRKYSVIARAERATRMQAPGGSFIWPYTSATSGFAEVLLVDDANSSDISLVEIVAFAGTLADARGNTE